MTKFLVMNDPHNSDRPPIGRTESYTDDIIAKQEECWEIAERTKCDWIVVAGDIFHRFRGPQIADSLKVRLIELYQQAPCPVYVVAGNHDLSMEGTASVRKMPFGVLAAAKSFTWLSEATVVARDAFSADGSVLLIPRNWEKHIDKIANVFKFKESELELKERYSDIPTIMVAHASILPPGKSAIYPHHNADKLPLEGVDLLICGHIHEDLGIHQLPSGCWYVNVGGMARVDRSKHNLERTPEVLTVTLEGGEFEFERDPLTSARPAEEAFFEKEMVTEREAGDFAASLDAALELEETPIDELVAQYTEGKSPAIVERLRGYLTEAES